MVASILAQFQPPVLNLDLFSWCCEGFKSAAGWSELWSYGANFSFLFFCGLNNVGEFRLRNRLQAREKGGGRKRIFSHSGEWVLSCLSEISHLCYGAMWRRRSFNPFSLCFTPSQPEKRRGGKNQPPRVMVALARLNLLQIESQEIQRSMFLNCMKFADRWILRLLSCKMFGQVSHHFRRDGVHMCDKSGGERRKDSILHFQLQSLLFPEKQTSGKMQDFEQFFIFLKRFLQIVCSDKSDWFQFASYHLKVSKNPKLSCIDIVIC